MSEEKSPAVREVTEVDEGILRDLQSRYRDVRCPIHDSPPRFDVDARGGVVESFCCDALLQIFRELKAKDQA
jgi:hypothetical protein